MRDLGNKLATSSVLLLFLVLVAVTCTSSEDIMYGSEEHVYYGYVPPSTDIAGSTNYQVDELVNGTYISYNVPTGTAILDIVGLEDDTHIEIWDIYTNVKIASEIINRLEKKHFYIATGSFFKLVASKRVAALLCGGSQIFETMSEWVGGTSTFYPAVTGGFRGREFIFVAAPPFHAYAYHKDRIGHNFNLFALNRLDWILSDSIGRWSISGNLKQRGSYSLLLQSRRNHNQYHNGAGLNVVFRLVTTTDAVVSCTAPDDFVAVPALTGGYVGKAFYAFISQPLKEEGRSAAFIILPLEEGKVTVYNDVLDVIAEKTFSSSDVANRNYWYHNLGTGKFKLIVRSTGNICFMVGQTVGTADINSLGDDITFIGARPNQEIRFYAPTAALIFAPEDLTVSINGETPIYMKKDEFRLLESGVHSVKADKHIIIQVLAVGNGWSSWGSYLIEPLDLDVTFEDPYNLFEKEEESTIYYYIVTIAITISIIAMILMLRQKIKRRMRRI